ncbi:hypothetical protein [Rhodococcus sp. B50]|uniref:hypothetical protein n=1 Tax=Rhodococcus sp. B50 TaxID=2682847 RepID=UPI001BD632CA|nr:hypothetical protein [Rhodococcus sp. B50]MBS9375497.1 hypothetical protein [Rhodococcus sp. B50]
MNEPEIVVDVARGDTELSRDVVTALQSIAGAVDDPALKSLVEQVATGRLGVRELARTEAFSRMLDNVVAPVFATLEGTPCDDLIRRQSREA